MHELLPADIFRIILFDVSESKLEIKNRMLVCKFWNETFINHYSNFAFPPYLHFDALPAIAKFSKLTSLCLDVPTSDGADYLKGFTQLHLLHVYLGFSISLVQNSLIALSNLTNLGVLMSRKQPPQQLGTKKYDWPPNLLRFTTDYGIDFTTMPIHLHTLKISKFYSSTINQLTNLTHLHCHRIWDWSSVCLTSLLKLKKLSISFKANSQEASVKIHSSISNLEKVKILCKEIGQKTLNVLSTNTNLKLLKIKPTNFSICTLDISPLAHLVRLHLTSAMMLSLKDLTHMSKLTKVSFDKNSYTQEHCKMMVQLPSLCLLFVRVSLRALEIVCESKSLQNIILGGGIAESMPFLTKMSSLKRMKVFQNLKDNDFEEILKLSNLETVKVSVPSSHSILVRMSSLKQLKALDLGNNSQPSEIISSHN